MQTAELNSEYLGVSHEQLMECAGYGTAQKIVEFSIRKKLGNKAIVVSGPGRNRGDGFATGLHLANLGFQVRVILVGREEDIHDSSTKQQFSAIRMMTDTVQFESVTDSALLRPVKSGIIIDAILGTG